MARAEKSTTAKENTKPAGELPGTATSPMAPRRLAFRAENVVPLLLIAGGALAFWVSLGFPLQARRIPLAMSAGIIGLSAIELFRQLLFVQQPAGQIMDLGMRSTGVKGASRAGLLLAELFVLFAFLATTIRLDNAAIAFAALVPLVFLSGRQRWLTAAITGSILVAWAYGFMNYFMAVVWPEPVLGQWLLRVS
jgi:hypothetical protein